ncbi:hypothetical protein [Microvirga aerophila]|uniref:Uncharacterized protein n=1 Tax=Microvirga aerophila TaxID=670291 RepID=A0A512BZK2_9HYPH|nr:hypothetical protein [Microvirga aerophila]GEO17394.1 hypothetical protein MAE02_50900 [Microvirga aerophila]
MSDFTAIERNGALKSYFECPPEIYESDMKYFEAHWDSSHRIREPFDDELKNPDDAEAYLIVVRRHTWDALERRLFAMDESVSLDFDELTARLLWVAWDQYLFSGKTSMYVLSVMEQGLRDLINFPPIVSTPRLKGRYTPSLGCMYIADARHHSSTFARRLRWLQRSTKPYTPSMP